MPILEKDTLRKLHRKPVFVKLLDEYSYNTDVGVVDMSDPDDSDNGVWFGGSLYSILYYGKTWVAYLYEQKPKHKWIKIKEDRHPYGTKCPLCGIIINVNQDGDFQDYKFCPYCGERLGM